MGKAALGFGQIGSKLWLSLQPKAPFDLYICNMENIFSTFSQSCFIGSSPNVQIPKTGVKSQISAGLDHSLQCYAPLGTGKNSHRL